MELFNLHPKICKLFAFILLLMLPILHMANARHDEISSLVQERKYPEAVTQLKELLRASTDVETRSRYYHQLGEIYYNYTQQYPEALKAYNRILSLSENGIPIAEIYLTYIKIGDVYCRIGNYNRAIQYLEALIGMAPETHFVHDIGRRKIRDIQTALDNLDLQKEIIQKYMGTPLESVALFQIAELYRSHSQLNQPELAITTYQTLLNKHPNDRLAAEAQWRIAHIRHTILHQLPYAIEAYRKVAEKYPTTNFAAEALFHIGNLHRQESKYELALNFYETIIEEYTNFWNMHAVYYWSGICHEQVQNYSEAQKALKIFLNVYLPNLDPVYFGQIEMYDKSISEVNAFVSEKIKTISELIPKHEFEKLEKAINEGRYIEAQEYAINLIVIAPNTQFAKKAADQLTSLKHLAAIQNLQSYLTDKELSNAEKIRTQLQIATIYERELMEYSKALQAYDRVVQEDMQSPYAAEALYRIGIIYADILEKPNTAIQTFNTITTKHPDTLQAMMATYQVGEIYHSLQRLDEALKAYETTIAYPERELYLSGGYKDSFADRAQFRIGRVHFEDQRFTDAQFAFEEFIKTRTDSPRLAAAYIYLAIMYQESNEKEKALNYFQQAEELAGNNLIQKRMIVEEAGALGFQSIDKVLEHLQNYQKRIKAKQ